MPLGLSGSQLVVPGGYRAVSEGGSRIITAGPCTPCCEEGFDCSFLGVFSIGVDVIPNLWNFVTIGPPFWAMRIDLPGGANCGGTVSPGRFITHGFRWQWSCHHALKIRIELEGNGSFNGGFPNPGFHHLQSRRAGVTLLLDGVSGVAGACNLSSLTWAGGLSVYEETVPAETTGTFDIAVSSSVILNSPVGVYAEARVFLSLP